MEGEWRAENFAPTTAMRAAPASASTWWWAAGSRFASARVSPALAASWRD
ncbi:hypothetical protein RR42_s1205 [Cupriavidus basilensis]|uniref:Uncharacterized protein n=1 Tax=Cupriavidus basilensis TaxID=68895 RepID=A0A0C4YIF0_9BURK|nr:hypothetical protein RR42_s1205 [Cupriavidus basilensis]